jgi:histidine ammonia-lyase
VLVATELVASVRAVRLARNEPVGAGSRALYEAAAARLDADMRDRPLHPDIEAARLLVEGWPNCRTRSGS